MNHVFVLRANILRLKADAWMLPTDANYRVRPQWTEIDPTLPVRVEGSAPLGFGDEGHLAFAVPAEDGAPLPIATAVPWNNVWSAEVTEARVQAFASIAASALGTHPGSRPHLLAIPFLGSGGGQAFDLGNQVANLLNAARSAAREHEVSSLSSSTGTMPPTLSLNRIAESGGAAGGAPSTSKFSLKPSDWESWRVTEDLFPSSEPASA